MNTGLTKRYTAYNKRMHELLKIKNKMSRKIASMRRRIRGGELPQDFKIFDPNNFIGNSESGRSVRFDINRGLKRFSRMRECITNTISTIGRNVIKYSGRDKAARPEILGVVKAQDGDEFGRRWEEMICQTSWNITKILTLTNPELKTFVSKCNFDYNTGNYYAGSNQCMDIQVVKHTPDEDDLWSGRMELHEKILEFLPDSPGGSGKKRRARNYKTQEDAYYFKKTSNVSARLPSCVYPKLSDTQDYSVMINSHVINSNLMRNIRADCRGISYGGAPVYLFKTVIPGPHYALSIYYPLEKRVEYFDPGGSWGGEIGYRDTEGNVPYSVTLEKLTSGRRGSKARRAARKRKSKYIPRSFTEFEGYDGGDPVEDALCLAFQNIFGNKGGVEFVAINLVNLQVAPEDAHCQVWVWLYVYIKFVLNMSTRDTLKYFSLLEKKALLPLIEHWREYLLYFDIEGSESPPSISKS